MVKPWLFEFFRAAGESNISILDYGVQHGASSLAAGAQFDGYWDMWTRAEGYGFEGIFFSEHHFGVGYSPSPNLLIAALAKVTTTLRLGVMGVVLPYYEVWRVIEEIGMLDQLTNGRLEVGTASGIPPEMGKIGLRMEDATGRNEEAQDVLDWALTHPGQPINHNGKIGTWSNLTLVPPPRQLPSPNRWTTVVSEASARRSAKRGTRICTGFLPVEGVQKVFDCYREEATKVGFEATPDMLGLRRIILIHEDGAKARAMSDEMLAQMREFFAGHQPEKSHGPVPDAAQKSDGGQQVTSDEFIAGTPEEVAEHILNQCNSVGAGHFLALMDNHGGLEENKIALELFGREVIPRLRTAEEVLPSKTSSNDRIFKQAFEQA